MNYTKGPWRVNIWDYPNANPPRKDLVIENSTNRIAVLDWDQGLDNPYTIKNDEAQANARLISSVPDMYEALRNLVDCAGLTWLDGYKSELDAVMRAAHNALNKAEGRQNE